MADDPDDLTGRLDRIEALLRRRLASAPPVTAGPEVRSARSIVSRIDDVWVAVTEGNERIVAAIDGAGDAPDEAGTGGAEREPGALARIEDTLQTLVGRLDHLASALAEIAATAPVSEGDDAQRTRLAGIDQAPAGVGESDATARLGLDRIKELLTSGSGAIHPRLDRIEEALADLARAGAESGAGADDATIHLRLNRIEEALAGVAGRVAEQAPGSGGATAAAVGHLDAEVRRLGRSVEALAEAVGASAARSGDGTLTDRLGRLRDQFRRP